MHHVYDIEHEQQGVILKNIDSAFQVKLGYMSNGMLALDLVLNMNKPSRQCGFINSAFGCRVNQFFFFFQTGFQFWSSNISLLKLKKNIWNESKDSFSY